MARPTTASETSARILDVAEHLVQTRGFNAFSYADVAEALKVTKASLHYHFATKAELGASLVERYRTSFLVALNRIDEADSDAGTKLSEYVGIYINVLENDRMCLCGMLGAEYATLPTAMQDGVRRFFDANEAWLVHLLSSGRKKKQLAFAGPPIEAARLLVSALEGGMLLARSRNDLAQMRSVAKRLLIDFGVKSGARPGSLGLVQNS
jgi:TetR/AcrR family transcriptional regulator, transcriptional repressor for nem operon